MAVLVGFDGWLRRGVVDSSAGMAASLVVRLVDFAMRTPPIYRYFHQSWSRVQAANQRKVSRDRWERADKFVSQPVGTFARTCDVVRLIVLADTRRLEYTTVVLKPHSVGEGATVTRCPPCDPAYPRFSECRFL